MEKKEYFVISNMDGDTIVQHLTKEELLNALGSDEESNEFGPDLGFIENLKKGDTNEWGYNILIIKGEIVIPKPKKIITAFDV